jgi:hypothetical protein
MFLEWDFELKFVCEAPLTMEAMDNSLVPTYVTRLDALLIITFNE